MRFTNIFLFFALFFSGVAYAAEPPKPVEAQRALTVAAASDLTFPLREIALLYEKDTGVKVTLSFGSTGMLASQIAQGAPFDVFFSADSKKMDELKDRGRVIPDTVEVYARGRIVLAVNKRMGVNASALKDLLSPDINRVAIANPDHAPYGRAAMEALKAEGIWDKIKDKLVYGENIRQALQFIRTGDAQAGIIALSVADAPELVYTLIDIALYNPLNQAVAVIRTTKEETAAREFIGFVNGPKGRSVMKRYGFLLPGQF